MLPFPLSLSGGLVVALVSLSAGSLDLLIVEDYRLFLDEEFYTTCPSCTAGEGDNCTVERTFGLEGECTGMIGSDSYTKLYQGENNSICFDVFSDSQCRNFTGWGCDERDRCLIPANGGPTVSLRSLPDWCIAADEPSGDYRIPLIRQYFHAEDDPFCNGTIDATRFSLVDPNICETTRVREPVLGARLHGSVKIQCEQNGGSVETGYLNQQCDGRVAKDYPLRIENGGCTRAANGLFLSQADCASPKWYCKNIVGEVLGFFEISEQLPSSEASQYAEGPFSLLKPVLVNMSLGMCMFLITL